MTKINNGFHETKDGVVKRNPKKIGKFVKGIYVFGRILPPGEFFNPEGHLIDKRILSNDILIFNANGIDEAIKLAKTEDKSKHKLVAIYDNAGVYLAYYLEDR